MLACRAGGLDADIAHQIKHNIRTAYGELWSQILKKKKHITPEQR